MVKLSKNQNDVISGVKKWLKKPNNKTYITVGGYAGTGKTTLISYLRKELHKEYPNYSVAFCSFTGKAARVLQNKLKENNSIYSIDTVGTIHSLIYSPVTNTTGEITGWERRKEIKTNLIIIDEASMVNEEIWNDISSYKIPIIAVGDHGQLPPIRGNFNLMQKPDFSLEEIYRQEAENPIIELSIKARTKGVIEPKVYSSVVYKIIRGEESARDTILDLMESYNNTTLILCGFNSTRIKLNKYIRGLLGYETEEPEPGDKVICLKNNHTKEIFNGMIGKIKSLEKVDEDLLYVNIDFEEEGIKYHGQISRKQFNNKEQLFVPKEIDLFDFGYALTVHKAQGSQAKRVIIFEEKSGHMDNETWKKWLYTAITRAEEELYIIGR